MNNVLIELIISHTDVQENVRTVLQVSFLPHTSQSLYNHRLIYA
jgi:hypothetical protein